MLSPKRLQKLKIKTSDYPIVEQRTITSRPMRKAAGILCLLAGGVYLFTRELQATSLDAEYYEDDYTETTIQRAKGSHRHGDLHHKWVGGGSAISTQRPSLSDYSRILGGEEIEEEEDSLVHVVPEVVRIPFEEAVRDVKLEGWEDEWFSHGKFDVERRGPLAEPKLDFVYNWVNGSDDAFVRRRHEYEVKSPLNDPAGEWMAKHGINRYRDWDELRYSLRSLDVYALEFINKIQILVNSVVPSPTSASSSASIFSENDAANPSDKQQQQAAAAAASELSPTLVPQRPAWLKDDEQTNSHVQVLPQESFFALPQRQQCLPTFNSLAIESQLHLTPSTTDHLVALSDDMFLGQPHSASDFYSPLFGSVMAFKPDSYDVASLGSSDQWPRFGEKPFVYYTSYLLNHRFGRRKRHVQAHFTHSISRSLLSEAMSSFPGPAARGACEKFRGESDFQLYPWFAGFHYGIERFREALLWSVVATRADADGDGYLDWEEREGFLSRMVEPGWRRLATKEASEPAPSNPNRERMYYRVHDELRRAGLQPPRVNDDVLWTSLDGPETVRHVKCHDFTVDKCFGDSFGSPLSDSGSGTRKTNVDFTTSNVLSRLSAQHPECGDCLIKFVLADTARGLDPLLPPRNRHRDREVVVKALKKYQHTVVDSNSMKFVMVKDAKQAEAELLDRMVRKGKSFGQYCLNDDVMTEKEEEVDEVREVMEKVFEGLWPTRGRWEKEVIG